MWYLRLAKIRSDWVWSQQPNLLVIVFFCKFVQYLIHVYIYTYRYRYIYINMYIYIYICTISVVCVVLCVSPILSHLRHCLVILTTRWCQLSKFDHHRIIFPLLLINYSYVAVVCSMYMYVLWYSGDVPWCTYLYIYIDVNVYWCTVWTVYTHWFNCHSRILDWRYLPYIRPL